MVMGFQMNEEITGSSLMTEKCVIPNLTEKIVRIKTAEIGIFKAHG